MLRETSRSVSLNGHGHQTDYGVTSIVSKIGGTPFTLRKGEFLFAEGDDGRGVFVIKTGRVKLSTCLPDGKLVIVHIAEPGAIIGLSAVLGNCEHEVTAEAIEPTLVGFIRGDEVRFLLKCDPDFAFRAADEMARRYRSAHSLICTLAKSDPVLIKLARLVSEWLSETGSEETQFENVFTHQQIAEMLGTTRETVTRAFRYLRECGILTLKGHLLEVHDVYKLRALAADCDMPHRR